MLYIRKGNVLLCFYSTDFANLLGSGTLANKSSIKVCVVCLLIYRLTTIVWRILMLKARGTGESFKASIVKEWIIPQPLDLSPVRPRSHFSN